MNIYKLKESLETLYTLTKMQIDNKNMYKTILEDMESEIPLVKNDRHDNMTMSLGNHMNDLGNKVNNALTSNDNIDKIYFWIDYIKWSVWETLRDEAIGHLSDLKIDNAGITFIINLHPVTMKSYNETKEEYENRKNIMQKYQEENEIKIIQKSYGKFFEFNEHNKIYLENFIKKYCEPYKFDYVIKDNALTQMTFKIKSDSIFLFKRKKEKEKEKEILPTLTNLEIENISNSVKEWYHAIGYITMFENHDSKEDYLMTVSTLGLTIYSNLCDIFEIENDVTKFYKKNNNSNKERNLYIRKKEKEIGMTFNLNEILKYFKQTKNKIEEIIQNDFCFFVDNFCFKDGINELKLRWCRDISIITSYDPEKEKELLKMIKNNYDYEYNEEDKIIKLLGTDKNIDFIKNTIATRMKSEISNINISFENNNKYISEVVLINRNIKDYVNI